jgi:hypothetical protein
MANYTNPTNVSQFLQRSLSANETAALNNFILNAVDKWIDRKLESTFSDQQPSTRYFDGGAHSIDIDPVQAITAVGSLNNDGSAAYNYTENTEIVYEPVNEVVKRELVYRGRGRRFPRGSRRMAVTGRFTEYDYVTNAVPYDIAMAATRLAAGILNAGRMAGLGENLQEEQLEGHMIRYNITQNGIATLADSDPILQEMIMARRQLYIYSDDDQGDDDYDW